MKEAGRTSKDAREREAAPADRAMTMMIQRVNANSPAQAVKSRARGPTITRVKEAALVAAAELEATSGKGRKE